MRAVFSPTPKQPFKITVGVDTVIEYDGVHFYTVLFKGELLQVHSDFGGAFKYATIHSKPPPLASLNHDDWRMVQTDAGFMAINKGYTYAMGGQAYVSKFIRDVRSTQGIPEPAPKPVVMPETYGDW